MPTAKRRTIAGTIVCSSRTVSDAVKQFRHQARGRLQGEQPRAGAGHKTDDRRPRLRIVAAKHIGHCYTFELALHDGQRRALTVALTMEVSSGVAVSPTGVQHRELRPL